MREAISFFVSSIYSPCMRISRHRILALSRSSGRGDIKMAPLSLSIYYLSPSCASSLSSLFHAIFRQDLPLVPPVFSLTSASRFCAAPSYREVHNPEGLITYSSWERESRYEGATRRLISPIAALRREREGESLSTLFFERVLPLRSNSIYP